jgi:hypothetical protein
VVLVGVEFPFEAYAKGIFTSNDSDVRIIPTRMIAAKLAKREAKR